MSDRHATVYVQSTSTDKSLLQADIGEEATFPAWGISVIRSSRGQIYVNAMEGKREIRAGRMSSFQVTIFGCRTVNINLDAKRLTDKVYREGIDAMKAKLIAEGLAFEVEAAKAA